MNIAFIGAPCSGKTTTAAKVFAKLKELAIPCEFISEQARFYIAEQRSHGRNPVVLQDSDQMAIMSNQNKIEYIFSLSAGPEMVLVSDSSPLNALLYMTEEARKDIFVQNLAVAAAQRTHFVFYCPPVSIPLVTDQNRVHNKEQSEKIDKLIAPVIGEFVPTYILLSGDPDVRANVVINHVLNKYLQ